METVKTIKAGITILELIPKDYLGGIALWGALPAVFNSSKCPDENTGVHVHARTKVGGEKEIDETFDIVRVHFLNNDGQITKFDINGQDAANYNISTIFNKRLKYLTCPACSKVHSDKEYWAVTYHTKHICEHCGESFFDNEPSISNAVMLLKEICGDVLQEREINNPVDRSINVKRKTFKGGMQIWGSNPAILWTSPKIEEGGIHFHGFQMKSLNPTVDETFGTLIIDNILLDPEMTRHLMAQNALNHLQGLVYSLKCDSCNKPHFDRYEQALNPHLIHKCEFCSSEFIASDFEKCVSNPLIEILKSFS